MLWLKKIKIIILIWIACKNNSHLQFCQLIGDCFKNADNYYKEDKELEKALKKIYFKL